MPSPSPQSDGNRKDPRARVLNMTVRYRSATVDEFIENHSHDISRGGMFIKTRSPFPAGTLLKFEVRIAEDQKLMHGVGRVVWRREGQENGGDPPAGMGIKFIKTGEGASALIEQLVNARKGKASNFETGSEQEAAQSASAETAVANGQPIDSSRTTMPPPDFVDSGDEAAPVEVGILVSSPPKARHDHAPERRKVVLKEESAPVANAPEAGKERSSEPPATLPPRAQRAPESAHGAAVSPEVARAAQAAAETPKQSAGLGGIAAALAIAAGGLLLFRNVGSQQSDLPAAEPTAAATSAAARPATAPLPTSEPVAVAPATERTETPEPLEAPPPAQGLQLDEPASAATEPPRQDLDEKTTVDGSSAGQDPREKTSPPASNTSPSGESPTPAEPSPLQKVPSAPVAPKAPVVAKVSPPQVKPAVRPTPPKVSKPVAAAVAVPTPPAQPVAPKPVAPAKKVVEPSAKEVSQAPVDAPSTQKTPPEKVAPKREASSEAAAAQPKNPSASASPKPAPQQPPRADDNPY